MLRALPKAIGPGAMDNLPAATNRRSRQRRESLWAPRLGRNFSRRKKFVQAAMCFKETNDGASSLTHFVLASLWNFGFGTNHSDGVLCCAGRCDQTLHDRGSEADYYDNGSGRWRYI